MNCRRVASRSRRAKRLRVCCSWLTTSTSVRDSDAEKCGFSTRSNQPWLPVTMPDRSKSCMTGRARAPARSKARMFQSGLDASQRYRSPLLRRRHQSKLPIIASANISAAVSSVVSWASADSEPLHGDLVADGEPLLRPTRVLQEHAVAHERRPAAGLLVVRDARRTRLKRRDAEDREQPIDESFAQRRLLVRQTAELARELLARGFSAVGAELERVHAVEDRRGALESRWNPQRQFRERALRALPAAIAAHRDADAVDTNVAPVRRPCRRATL